MRQLSFNRRLAENQSTSGVNLLQNGTFFYREAGTRNTKSLLGKQMFGNIEISKIEHVGKNVFQSYKFRIVTSAISKVVKF